MVKNFIGIIVEESLESKSVLKKVKIIKTEVEKVTEEDKTPWLKQWTMHTVEISESKADAVAKEISKSLDSRHDWYADFKSDTIHYIIFRNKVFKVNRSNKKEYDAVVKHGVSLGIPEYQLDFSPEIK